MDYTNFIKEIKEYDSWGNDILVFNDKVVDDRVNSPSHYTAGSQEAIDIIEDAIKSSPNNVQGMLQGQVLKYLLRLWHKDNPVEDAKKARWYLNRLIEKMG